VEATTRPQEETSIAATTAATKKAAETQKVTAEAAEVVDELRYVYDDSNYVYVTYWDSGNFMVMGNYSADNLDLAMSDYLYIIAAPIIYKQDVSVSTTCGDTTYLTLIADGKKSPFSTHPSGSEYDTPDEYKEQQREMIAEVVTLFKKYK